MEGKTRNSKQVRREGEVVVHDRCPLKWIENPAMRDRPPSPSHRTQHLRVAAPGGGSDVSGPIYLAAAAGSAWTKPDERPSRTLESRVEVGMPRCRAP